MSTTIKCDNASLDIEKVDHLEIKITFQNIVIRLYKDDKVRELLFRMNDCYDGSYKASCSIEIILEKGASDIVFEFPYDYRYAVLQNYDMLRKLLKDFY
jgi:hypothetical protein